MSGMIMLGHSVGRIIFVASVSMMCGVAVGFKFGKDKLASMVAALVVTTVVFIGIMSVIP